MTQQVEKSLRTAFEMLRMAEAELHRPKEDAVTMCTCQSTRNSVREFFHSYLESKFESVPVDSSLSDLLDQCAKIDLQFKSVDISCFECKGEDTASCSDIYCLSNKKVSECFSKANVIRELVMAKLNIYEKDLT